MLEPLTELPSVGQTFTLVAVDVSWVLPKPDQQSASLSWLGMVLMSVDLNDDVCSEQTKHHMYLKPGEQETVMLCISSLNPSGEDREGLSIL